MIQRIEIYPEHYPAIDRPRRRYNYQIVNDKGDVLAYDEVRSVTIKGAELAAGLYSAKFGLKPQVRE